MSARRGAIARDPPASRWEGVLRWWRTYQWWVLGTLAVAAYVLGHVGFREHFGPGTRPVWDLVYLSLQLFVLESGGITGPIPWVLEVARFLAPAIAAYGIAAVVAGVFRDEVIGLRARWRRGHAVVCGLEAGWSLINLLHEGDERVVVIERDPDHPRIEACRARHIPVFVGDARDEQLLVTAGVRRARRLVTVCGDDAVNVKVAEQARRLAAGRRQVRVRPAGSELRVLVHIEDPYLCELLTMQELERPDDDTLIDFFSLYSGGARALLREYPVAGSTGTPPHIVVVGLGRLGRQLIVQAARDRAACGRSDDPPLWITAVDAAADQVVEDLRTRHRFLDRACQLRTAALLPDAVHLLEEPSFGRAARPGASAIFVCLPEDADGLQAGLALRRQLRHTDIPVVVRTYDADLAALEPSTQANAGGLFVFDQMNRTCGAEDLFAGANEVLARALHDAYLRQRAAAGDTPATNPSVVGWAELPMDKRDSNRRQADHIAEKLAAAGCELGPLTDPDAELFSFTPDEVERLATMEHDRWRQDCSDGHPDDVPWEELSDDDREIDRNFIRRLPALLATVGFQVNRVAPEPGRAAAAPVARSSRPSHPTAELSSGRTARRRARRSRSSPR